MGSVKIFHEWERKKWLGNWRRTVEILCDLGVEINKEIVPADVSLVIGGMFENPISLPGKKVLFYDENDWMKAWSLFGFVLSEYYDETIDLTGRTPEGRATIIIERMGEYEK